MAQLNGLDPLADRTPLLAELVSAIRAVVRLEGSPAETARLVARQLENFLSRPDLLPAEYRAGDPEHYQQYVVHTERDGSFSVVALVWQPGQETLIHDHVAWCVAGVYEGAETERRYELRGGGATARLVPVADIVNGPRMACSFAPPGDIHQVCNAENSTLISIHIYGADISKLGTSVRRSYFLPVAQS